MSNTRTCTALHLATLHPAGSVPVNKVLGNKPKVLVLCMLQRNCRERGRGREGGREREGEERRMELLASLWIPLLPQHLRCAVVGALSNQQLMKFLPHVLARCSSFLLGITDWCKNPYTYMHKLAALSCD